MSNHEPLDEFAGLPVVDFADQSWPADAGKVAWRLRDLSDHDDPDPAATFEEFLEEVDTTEVTALVIAYWTADHPPDMAPPCELLVAAADRFPNLRALFIGDVIAEESELSWILQGDITPLLEAYPRLEHLEVRGGDGLVLRPFRSEDLTVLAFESAGLPAEVVRAIGESDLPGLEELDVWLGSDRYGGDAEVEDLAPILGGERLPALRHLGIENSEIQDEIAAAVAAAPVVARLESLSLAMGMLTDEGAEALLSGQPLTHLKELDLHHHFLSEDMAERLTSALDGVDVDLDEGLAGSDDDLEEEDLYIAFPE